MLHFRSALLYLALVVGAFLLPLQARSKAWAQQNADPPPATAAELLEDGTDAIADHAPESAERILKQLVETYPNSPEAARARHALATLNHEADSPDVRAAIRASEAERTGQYRQAFLIDVGDRVFFSENSSAIGGRARSVIASQGRWLKARPNLSVTIVGRSDDGDSAGARQLSALRAQAVRDRLVASGVDARRIDIKAAGDKDKLALCDSPLCQAQNRNAEVFINDWHENSGWKSGAEDGPPVAVGRRTAESDQAP